MADRRWQPSVALAAGALLLTRAVVWATAVLAIELAGVSRRAADFDPAGLTEPFGHFGDVLVGPAARWDSVWFLSIANDGYNDAVRAAFFPLYPFVSRAAGAVVGSALLGGIVVSLACAVAGLAALHRLTAIELGEAPARATVILVACFPTAFFLSAVYSESLFLALSVGTVLAARTGR